MDVIEEKGTEYKKTKGKERVKETKTNGGSQEDFLGERETQNSRTQHSEKKSRVTTRDEDQRRSSKNSD